MTGDVIINGRFLSRQITGVERYGRELIPFFRGGYRVEKTRRNGLAGHAWEQFVLPMKLTSNSVLWSPANTGPLFVRNQALTIHDLSPLEHPEWYRKSFATWYRLILPILIKRVRVIFTPSQYVKQKVMKRFAVKNVVITPNGVDTTRFYPEAWQSSHDLPEKFILFVGSLQPRKNIQVLFRAWNEIKNEFLNMWLVIAGNTGTVFANNNLSTIERVRFLGYVSDNDLPGIYAKATTFVLPSIDEGFGLPALEAMACGVPVIVSDGGALQETVGDAALIFKAMDSNCLSKVIREYLNDQDMHSSLVARGAERVKQFSWQKSAETIWKALHEI